MIGQFCGSLSTVRPTSRAPDLRSFPFFEARDAINILFTSLFRYVRYDKILVFPSIYGPSAKNRVSVSYKTLNLITVVRGIWTALRFGTIEIREYDLYCDTMINKRPRIRSAAPQYVPFGCYNNRLDWTNDRGLVWINLDYHTCQRGVCFVLIIYWFAYLEAASPNG